MINTQRVLNAYFKDTPRSCAPYGNGHINSTFLVITDKKYILQKINTSVFIHPEDVVKNIRRVTEHIRNKARLSGGDVERSAPKLVQTLDGKDFFRDGNEDFWRMYEFTEGTVAYERIECPHDFYNCGYGFGQFQSLMADYPADELRETIKNFHNTPKRYENLINAVKRNASGRAAEVSAEIEFAKNRKEFCEILEDAHKNGDLPLRVTHNDTKLNNILFDEKTGAPVCVVDLDTVMPGYSVTDFGDSIRFGANTALEDETDLSKVSLDLELFEEFARGFLKGCGGSLTKKELELLPIGAIMMTLECGMRFLTDHIDGDVYFKIHRKSHNLDRARNQFALVEDMEKKLPQMNEIINKLK